MSTFRKKFILNKFRTCVAYSYKHLAFSSNKFQNLLFQPIIQLSNKARFHVVGGQSKYIIYLLNIYIYIIKFVTFQLKQFFYPCLYSAKSGLNP